MKKIISAVLTSVLALNLFAAPKASNRVNLKVWESSGPESAFILWAIDQYRKVNPKVKISYEAVGHTESRAKIELDGPAGVGADIFVCPHDHIGALVSSGNILPIDNAQEYMKDFLDMAKVGSTYEGVCYGYPLAAETYALFYNKDLIKQAPKTWDEIILFANKFNDKHKNKYALVWSVGDGYYDYIFMESFDAPLFGPNGNDRKQHNLNSANAIKGLTYFQNLRKQILDIPASDATGDFCNAQFSEGNAAMIITGPWSIPTFTKQGINLGVAPLPTFPSKQSTVSFSGVRLAFVSSYSEHPAEAKEFAKFLTSKEILQKRYEMTNQIPPRKDININNELVNGIREQLKHARPMPTIPQLGTYWSAMNSAYAGIWDGGDVRSNLNAAAAAMEAAK